MYIAYFENGNYRGRRFYSNPDHIKIDQRYEVGEIDKELYNKAKEYPLELKNGKVQVNQTKKTKIDADKAETKRIKDKVENKKAISNTELAWLQIYGGL